MTPKQKAIDLFNKIDYVVCGDINKRNQKDMALLCVDEIIETLNDNTDWTRVSSVEWTFWNDVKTEINNIE